VSVAQLGYAAPGWQAGAFDARPARPARHLSSV
jgi:hypothetical protein